MVASVNFVKFTAPSKNIQIFVVSDDPYASTDNDYNTGFNTGGSNYDYNAQMPTSGYEDQNAFEYEDDYPSDPCIVIDITDYFCIVI